ncbi:MAG: hypothetical protein CMO46_05455 [Verrucomicrobiales bacterium]|jgi:hypothetical protein|nr:hypothetical protein [Verrucomicrobiales bacterium]|tara:strand:+ start:4104 stop:4469 length:366 start_codon:yes stop_codon:yes gene_type:complete
MRVRIIKSPNRKKKFRAILNDGGTVDFGASGYSDYTKHKNPLRMRSYILRHGGQVPTRVVNEPHRAMVHRMMLGVDKSDREEWSLKGIETSGFWARWYLWSQPTIPEVQRFMAKRFGIRFI